MATSGTIGRTIISTNKVIEHALRRAGIAPSQQTPETVDIARECLYLLLMHYGNDGLNLWCVEPKILGCVPGKKNYELPAGTVSILNVLHATPQLATVESVVGGLVTLVSSNQVTRVGLQFSVLPTADFQIISYDELGNPTTQVTVPVYEITSTTQYYWFNFGIVGTYKQVGVNSGSLTNAKVATVVSEIPMSPFNRDDYASLPNKDTSSEVCTNYLFNKTLAPFISVWPVASNADNQIVVWVHHQIQDVGQLTQTLAIPERWFEATIIQLAFRLSMELPGVDPNRVKMLLDLSGKFTIEASNEETDSAPIMLQPNISHYTR